MVGRDEHALELGKRPSARGRLDTASPEQFFSARYCSAEQHHRVRAANAPGPETGRLFAGVVEFPGQSTSLGGRCTLRRGNGVSTARHVTSSFGVVANS